MSNFFTRSKDDMKYLFKNKEELSKKERKRKRRGWGTLIGLILVLIQLIVSGLLLFNIFKLDILPLKYLIAVNAFLLLIFLYDFTSQFTKAHIIGKILAVLMSGVIVFIYLVSSKLDSVLNKLNLPEINTDIVDVVVLADDKASSLMILPITSLLIIQLQATLMSRQHLTLLNQSLTRTAWNLQNTNHGMTL